MNCLQDGFLYYSRARTVFDFILFGIGFALQSEQMPENGRPPEVGSGCQVHDIVEAIPIISVCVVRKLVAQLLSVHVHSRASAPHDNKAYVELTRKSLVRRITEVMQWRRLRVVEPTADFQAVCGGHLAYR